MEGFPFPPIQDICVKFMSILSIHYNFSFDYDTESSMNINQMENGSWHGFIGDLINSKADIVLWLSNTYQRDSYVDFTTPWINNDAVLFSPLPRYTLKWQAMFLALQPEVWFCIILTMVIFIPVFYFQMVLNSSDHRFSNQIWSLSAILPMYAIFQASISVPKPVKWTFISLVFYSIIICTCFTSNLTSFLTLPEADPLPKSLKDLSKMKNLQIDFIGFPGSNIKLFFDDATSPVYVDIRNRMNLVHPKNMEAKMVDMALDGKSVIINYELNGLLAAAESLQVLPQINIFKKTTILSSPVSLVLQKFSKFTEAFNVNAGKLHVTGIFAKMLQSILGERRKKTRGKLKSSSFYQRLCQISKQLMTIAETKPFTMKNLMAPFFILSIGLVISVASFGIETSWGCNKPLSDKIKGSEIPRKEHNLFQKIILINLNAESLK
ncbi:unnamed protein product [Allacma fusca]|uniref:Ionotropic glutamate receptor C-terminal domain-containing protein n=1 Tax=Allacma fusca TaxID=39272 RepID=A0A8J2JE76_9HEXA|nr:unnamed protein product [Allacma fusca]